MATQPPVDDLNDSSEPPAGGGDDIAPISIVEEMKTSYLDYAMSVIVSRALFIERPEFFVEVFVGAVREHRDDHPAIQPGGDIQLLRSQKASA